MPSNKRILGASFEALLNRVGLSLASLGLYALASAFSLLGVTSNCIRGTVPASTSTLDSAVVDVLPKPASTIELGGQFAALLSNVAKQLAPLFDATRKEALHLLGVVCHLPSAASSAASAASAISASRWP